MTLSELCRNAFQNESHAKYFTVKASSGQTFSTISVVSNKPWLWKKRLVVMGSWLTLIDCIICPVRKSAPDPTTQSKV